MNPARIDGSKPARFLGHLTDHVTFTSAWVDDDITRGMAVYIPSFFSMFPKLYAFNVTANAASDWILHPTQKLDYGFLNPLLGRPVGSL